MFIFYTPSDIHPSFLQPHRSDTFYSITEKHGYNLVDRYEKKSKTELPDLSNYVQMSEKRAITRNANEMKFTHSLSRSIKETVVNVVTIIYYSIVVYAGEILGFALFKASNDNLQTECHSCLNYGFKLLLYSQIQEHFNNLC